MLCRICLNNSDLESEFKNIFSNNGIESLILKYLNLETKPEDSISHFICIECLTNLENFNVFYMRVEQIQADFNTKLNVLHDIKTEIFEYNHDQKIETNNEYKSIFDEANELLPLDDVPEKLDDNESNHTDFIDMGSGSFDESSNEESNSGKRTTRSNLIKSKESQPQLKKEKEKTVYQLNDEKVNLKISNFMKLICNLCGVELETYTLLKLHFRTEHKQKGYAVCCQKKFDKRVYLCDHIDSHLNPDQFKCKICHKIQSNHNQLSHHMKTVHEAVNNVQCDVCLRTVSNKQALELHKLTHIEEKNFKCTKCEKGYASEYQLKQHLLKVHENMYKNVCHVCGKIIKDKKLFRRHQAEHDGVIEPRQQCEKCGIWLKNSMSLRKHELNIHAEEDSKQICSICNKECPSKAALKSHKYYVHNRNRRTYTCTICHKEFRKTVSLKEHMTTHTGEILYTCPHCPKTFASNANYHHHRKKEHRKEWEEARLNKLKPPRELVKK